MPLQHVLISDAAYHHCVSHALITEREEVMGLLLGRISVDNTEAHIFCAETVPRSDKRTDRVEISPEHLVGITERAEQLGIEMGESVRVIGWYHSHPHITPHPSHVDLQSQAVYQTLLPEWVGLIFSCFNHDKARQQGSLTMHSFQTIVGPCGEHTHAKIPVSVVPARRLCRLPPAPLTCPVNLLDMLQQEAQASVAAIHDEFKDTPVPCELADMLHQFVSYKHTNVVAVEATNAMQHERQSLEMEVAQGRALLDAIERQLAEEFGVQV